MGMSRITQRYKPNDNMVIAYKVYEKRSTLYGKPIYTEIFKYGIKKEGIHYKATNVACTTPVDDKIYESGFHCFVHKCQAIEYLKSVDYRLYNDHAVCMVHAWDIRTRGFWLNRNVVVAKNLRIISEI